MRQHQRRQACLPTGRSWPSGTGCQGWPSGHPGAGCGQDGPGFGGLWLLLIPAACGGGPLLAAGLAAAGALAWGGLGLTVAAILAGGLLAIRRYRTNPAVTEKTGKPQLAGPEDWAR